MNKSKCLIICMLIYILSVVDGIITVRLVERGATELNPILFLALSSSQPGFFVIKMFFTTFGLMLLYHAREHHLAQKAMLFFLAMFSVLVGYQGIMFLA